MFSGGWADFLSHGFVVAVVAVAAVGLSVYDMVTVELGAVAQRRVRVAELILVAGFIALVALRFYTRTS